MAVIKKKEKEKPKMTANEVELILAKHFNIRQVILVPNVSWGMLEYETDLLMLSKSNYATEIEIKVDKYDLINDIKKKHTHNSKLIHYLYFAIPDYLEEYIEHVPVHAGILIIDRTYGKAYVRTLRVAKKHRVPKWTVEQRIQLMRLSTLRIWSLKDKLKGITTKYKELLAWAKKEGKTNVPKKYVKKKRK